ncbi:hypothetical protein AB0I00_06800 [Streptomyces sp. NPDC050803]
MAEQFESEGHCPCCSRRDGANQASLWLELMIRTIYEIVQNWPQ